MRVGRGEHCQSLDLLSKVEKWSLPVGRSLCSVQTWNKDIKFYTILMVIDSKVLLHKSIKVDAFSSHCNY